LCGDLDASLAKMVETNHQAADQAQSVKTLFPAFHWEWHSRAIGNSSTIHSIGAAGFWEVGSAVNSRGRKPPKDYNFDWLRFRQLVARE
jgi:hypothetical protein